MCTQDSSFGPAILSFPTDIIFLLCFCVRLRYLHQKPVQLKSRGWALLCSKAAAIAFIFVANVAALKALLDAKSAHSISLWLGAPIAQLICAVPLAILVYVEHFHCMRPSGLVICYTLVKGLFTAVALRSYLQIGVASSTVTFTSVVVAAYLFTMCVELVEKRRLLAETEKLPIVTTSSFIRRSLYTWLFPLLWRGHFKDKELTFQDCGPIPDVLGAKFTSATIEDALRSTKRTKNYLIVASMKAFGSGFLAPVLPRLVLLLATFAQPLLVNQTIAFVTTPDRPASFGWALVGGFVCVYALITFSTSLYWETVFDATVQYRGALVGSLYTKTLKLSSVSTSTLGGGVASTYMSVDVERICQGAQFFHEIWASLVSIALSIVLLYYQATWPAFLPLAVTVALILLGGIIGRNIGQNQGKWLAATDKRVKFLSSVIANFLPIKWSNYEDIMAKRATQLRREEMNEANGFYHSMNLTGSLSTVAGTICILSVLGPYAVLAGRSGMPPLDANRLFTIVAIVNLVATPLNLLGQFVPVLAASYASLQRIQGFLSLEEQDIVQTGKGSQIFSNHSKSSLGSMLGRSTNYIPLEATTSDVRIMEASFSWSPDAEPFLKDISADIDKPELHMCVGPVASGKTLFLLSILGEMTKTKGAYSVPNGRIAYAAQDAVIVPGTVRDNILFGTSFHEDWYHRVLRACALTEDLAKFSSGDATFLGGASRLSGGQAQRIALARAVYAQASVTLLDDVFIFTSLLGENGILRKKKVVLVTHDVKLLTAAHTIFVFDDGHITHKGSMDQIRDLGYDINVIGSTPKGGSAIDAAAPKGAEHVSEQESAEPPIAKTSRGFTPYLFFAKMGTYKQVVGLLLILALGGAIKIATQVYLREWATSNGSNFWAWAGGYAGLTLIWGLFQFTLVVTRHTGMALHAAELKGLFESAPSYLMSTPAGRIINRFSQDIFLTDFEFPINFLNFVFQSFTLLGTIVFIVVPTPWLALSIFPLGILYYFTLMFYSRTGRQLQQLEAASKSPLYTLFSTTVSGLHTIRAFKAESYFQDQNNAYLNNSQVPFYFRFASMRFLRTVLSMISFVVAVGLSALAIGFRHSTDPSSLGLALSNLTSLSALLSSLLTYLADVENGSVAISRIHEIATLPAEEVSAPPAEAPADWPSRGDLAFEDVQLSYRADLDPALRGVSFRVKAGQKVGVCGRSGSGKSSLILALFRALDKSLINGTIRVDDVDVGAISVGRLRKSLSLVAQAPFLWHASLRTNLDPEELSEEKDLWAALERVGMSEAVSALPEKLETVLEDSGSFSKGQRQLLCLARVLLRKRKIMVLDEASGSLDLETDARIREVIRSDFAECTVIAVAHRIATIVDFDLILVMEDGRIVERGSPKDLMAVPDSRFARLASAQGL
ncbi:P-loop containing nucleoside triphosphate hydrolase protein [Mycena sp. CBHHK59/15]|nr:P-loop containing nucleoside triphosphate hydrolase protein [Mycena sp. CBHHK59/15]